MEYKYLLAQPALLRFQWELDVVLTNIRSLDKTTPIVVLFTEDHMGVVEHIKGRYSGLEVHHYPDQRTYKLYPATTRPYLVYRYLSEDWTREQGCYFQIDSDVIFRELPDFQQMTRNKQPEEKYCIASDCSGYIDYTYLTTREQGAYIVERFAEILGISPEVIERTPGGGAQWLINRPTAELWYHIWQDSDRLYQFLNPLDSNIQKWTAEMWSQLYNLAKFGYSVELHPELDFCRPTDDIKMWDMVKILHNAGVTGPSAQSLFYKGQYENRTPFGEDFSWVRRDKAGLKYVEAINSVIH